MEEDIHESQLEINYYLCVAYLKYKFIKKGFTKLAPRPIFSICRNVHLSLFVLSGGNWNRVNWKLLVKERIATKLRTSLFKNVSTTFLVLKFVGLLGWHF